MDEKKKAEIEARIRAEEEAKIYKQVKEELEKEYANKTSIYVNTCQEYILSLIHI